VNVPDGEQGRSWTVKCTEDTVLNAQSLEQVPYISWKLVDAPRIGKHGERITVYEHPTDGEGRCPTCHGAGEFPVPIAPRDGFGNQHVEYELCSDPFHSARARSDVDAVTISRDEADHILDALGEAYSGYCPEGWNDQAKAVLAGTCDRIRERLQGEGE
jgi:hypothetical protein